MLTRLFWRCVGPVHRARANARHGPWVWLPLLWVGAESSGCSLLYDLETRQCQSASDCTSIGFDGYTCVAGFCQLPSAAGAGGSLAGSSGGDAGGSGGAPGGAGVDAGGSAPSMGGAGLGGAGLGGSGGDAGAGGQAGNAGAPSLSWLSSVPASGATGVDPATHLELTFDADVGPGTGELAVLRLSDDHVVETITLPDPRVTFSGSSLAVDFDAVLAGDTDYYVRVGAGAVTSGAASFAGIDDARALGFRTASVDYPGQVSLGLRSWFDADFAPSLKTSSGALVTWGDRSGVGGAVRQLESDARPLLAEGSLNARSTVSFDGSAYLALDSAVAVDSWDIFLVWRSSVAAETDRESLLLLNGPELRVRHGDVSASTRCSVTRTVGAEVRTLEFGAAEAAAPHLWNFTFDASSLRLYTRTDGSGPASSVGLSTRSGLPSGQFSLGGNANGAGLLVGEIAEVIVYDRVLSDTERQAVSTSLESKWGLGFVSCDGGETLGPTGDCYVYDATPRSWTNARTSCQGRGSGWSLVSVESSLENRFIAALLGGSDAWIGGQDDQPLPERFSWVSGVAFWNGSAAGSALNGSYVNWNSGEPNGGSDQSDCVRILDSAYWADYTCTGQFGSVCRGPGSAP